MTKATKNVVIRSHQARAGNVAVGIALTHARQDLSILKHFEP